MKISVLATLLKPNSIIAIRKNIVMYLLRVLIVRYLKSRKILHVRIRTTQLQSGRSFVKSKVNYSIRTNEEIQMTVFCNPIRRLNSFLEQKSNWAVWCDENILTIWCPFYRQLNNQDFMGHYFRYTVNVQFDKGPSTLGLSVTHHLCTPPSVTNDRPFWTWPILEKVK